MRGAPRGRVRVGGRGRVRVRVGVRVGVGGRDRVRTEVRGAPARLAAGEQVQEECKGMLGRAAPG